MKGERSRITRDDGDEKGKQTEGWETSIEKRQTRVRERALLSAAFIHCYYSVVLLLIAEAIATAAQ